jgi:predicted porin
MKKSLFALAAAGAFAGAAQAQSSVTVYGLVDVGYINASARAAGPGNGINNAAGNNVNAVSAPGGAAANFSALSGNAQSTSRLGFRGTEDLGGGTAAFFTVEIGLQPNNAQIVDSGVGQNRQTFVGVRQNGLGELSVGTQYTTVHFAAAKTDPGELNNMMGNVIYDKAAGLSAAAAGSAMNNGTLLGFSGMQNNTSYTVRSTNMLRLQTAAVSGFQGNAFYVVNSNTQGSVDYTGNGSRAGSTAGPSNNYGWGFGLDFTFQKAFLTANVQQFNNNQAVTMDTSAGTVTAGGPAYGYYGAGGASAGTNVKDTQQYYAGTYDFGILKAYVQYVYRKAESAQNSAVFAQRSATQIGIRSSITPKIQTWLSGGVGSVQGMTNPVENGNALVQQNTSKANFNGWQVGANYLLSKRTNLYAIYGQQSTSNMSIGYSNANAAVTTNNPTSYKASNMAVGVRHTF